MSRDPLSGCPDAAPGRAGAAVPSLPPGDGNKRGQGAAPWWLCSGHQIQWHSQVCASGMWEGLGVYRVRLRLMEPAVSRAEQAEGHLGVGPHLGQAGQGLAHLQGWRPMWEVTTQHQSQQATTSGLAQELLTNLRSHQDP